MSFWFQSLAICPRPSLSDRCSPGGSATSARAILAAAVAGLLTVVVFKSLIGAQIPGGELYNYLPSQVRPFMLTYL